MAEKKSSLLAVLEVLKDETDEDHVLSRNDILSRIESKRGLTMDRRTLYSCISMLQEYGYDISGFDENGKGYALTKRDFTPAEIIWLCNAVHASNFISAKASERLVKKLLETQSRHTRKEFSNTVYLPNQRKTENHALFDNIEQISAAIQAKQTITFTYLTYNIAKKLVEKRKEPYTVEPRYIVYAEGKGYVIVTDPKHPGQFIHYRLDRMKNVKVNESSAVTKLAKEQDPYDYAKNKLFMFAGENVSAVLRCRMSVLNQMIDLFGTEVSIAEEDNDSFRLCVTASEQGIVWLAQQYADAVEVISPQSVRETVINNLQEALARYGK